MSDTSRHLPKSRRVLADEVSRLGEELRKLRLENDLLRQRLGGEVGGGEDIDRGVVLEDPGLLVDASLGDGMTVKQLVFECRQGLAGVLQVSPALLGGKALLSLEDGVKASWPVFRRSGLRQWVQGHVFPGLVDPTRVGVQVVMRTMDVLETMVRPVPLEVSRAFHGKTRKAAFLEREPECVS